MDRAERYWREKQIDKTLEDKRMCEESAGNETILSNAQITNFYAECIDDAAKGSFSYVYKA